MKQDPPPPAPAPEILPGITVSVNHLEVDQIGIMSPEEESSNAQLEIHWEPGHKGAVKQLDNFISLKLKEFSQDKAKTDRKSTSHLSPYLHFGEVGVRTVRKAILDATRFWDKESCQSHVADFFRQIGFREYSRYLSFHFPFTHERSMLGYLRAVPWRYDQSLFKAWRTGNTGYPLVDAGMREIWSTGWMHNRCRVVCASFLVKHLLLPWQWGLKHYWDALLDADLECDALGWQYCAGCLSDGHVFSEVMDLDKEAKRYDPKGAYVRRWLPVLARIPTEFIHAPWKAPRQVLDDAGVELGVDYPLPVVQPEAAQITLSKAAEVISKAEQSSDINSYASGPYRPPTKALPETSSLTWDVAGHHYEASSIASLHSGVPKSGLVQQSGAASRSLLQECMSTHDPKAVAAADCTGQHPTTSRAACSCIHETPTTVSDWPPDKRAKLSLSHTNGMSNNDQ
jgi:deoxyribodipyrimidine photolyase